VVGGGGGVFLYSGVPSFGFAVYSCHLVTMAILRLVAMAWFAGVVVYASDVAVRGGVHRGWDQAVDKEAKRLFFEPTAAASEARKVVAEYAKTHKMTKSEAMLALMGSGDKEAVLGMLRARKELYHNSANELADKQSASDSSTSKTSGIAKAKQIHPRATMLRNGGKNIKYLQATKQRSTASKREVALRRKELIDMHRAGSMSDVELKRSLVELSTASKEGRLATKGLEESIRARHRNKPTSSSSPRVIKSIPASRQDALQKRKNLIQLHKDGKITDLQLKTALREVASPAPSSAAAKSSFKPGAAARKRRSSSSKKQEA